MMLGHILNQDHSVIIMCPKICKNVIDSFLKIKEEVVELQWLKQAWNHEN